MVKAIHLLSKAIVIALAVLSSYIFRAVNQAQDYICGKDPAARQ